MIAMLITFSLSKRLRRRCVALGEKKGRRCVSLFLLRCGNSLTHGYFDLPWLGRFRLRHAYLENAVFVGGFDAILLHGLGQGKGAPELCRDPLYVAVFNTIGWLLGFAFPTENQHPVLYFQFDVFLL